MPNDQKNKTIYCTGAQLRRIPPGVFETRGWCAAVAVYRPTPTRSYPAAVPVHLPASSLITYLQVSLGGARMADGNGLGLVAE